MPNETTVNLTQVSRLVIAGWTGRNVAALEAHIRELEALGVARPKSTPIFYRVASSLLTTADSIEVIGNDSTGEIEFVVYAFRDGLWIGVGSDHTDRKAETLGVTLSKQMCAKPVSPKVWRYDEVAPHWDRLVLRSFVHQSANRRLYQEGPVTTMRAPEELIRLHSGSDVLPLGTAMFCGTVAVHGEIEAGEAFEMELDDPVLERKLTHIYKMTKLPIED